MTAAFNTGVILLHSDKKNRHNSDYDILKSFLNNLEEVKVLWNAAEISGDNLDFIYKEIDGFNISRIIIAGFNAGLTKTFFSKKLREHEIEIADIQSVDFGFSSGNGSMDVEFIKSMLTCAILDISPNHRALHQTNSVNADTLVIGGGIAGIQAALEIADSGHKAYLVEKTGTIGGHMAMFDKTFPTLDCAACILTPKMVEAGQHPFIELITYSEVNTVSGVPGNYQVNILKKARRVNIGTCIGCGTCAEKCPSSAYSEFDADTTMRKAIYIPFPQAVPNKYLIDADSCRYVQTGKCGVCVKVCPVEECINLDEKDEHINIQVGNIIVATGFKPFDPKRIEQFGYGIYPNVVTSLEFERLVNASGPTEGHIRIRSQDKKGNWVFQAESPEPSDIALIHCVGSRDENYNKYCSRVCCMYSLKLAHLVKEKIPNARVFEYYIDMRSFGKGYEEFYERIKSEGVQLIKGRTAKITRENDKLVLRSEDILEQRISEQDVDMVILAVGLEPGEETKLLADQLGLKISCDGWFQESDELTGTYETYRGGIYIAGVCQGPKDIPDTVAHASAAASRVIQNIVTNEVRSGLDQLSADMVKNKAKSLSPSYDTPS